jgi:uncharacterized protein (TIGR00255 family)
MALSMTGYGSHTLLKKDLQVKCEIMCLNRKNLDLSLNLPRYCTFHELPLRKLLKEHLHRGKISIYFEVQLPGGKKSIRLNEPLFLSWKDALETMAKKHGMAMNVGLSDWMSAIQVWNMQDTPCPNSLLKECLEDSLRESIRKVLVMREKEGRKLEKDLVSRIRRMKAILKSIRKKTPRILKQRREKMKKQVRRYNEFDPVEVNLFNRFYALFSEKTDVTEELTRLESHLEQFEQYLKSSAPVGLTLNFLLQEILRESNTIGSKSQDLAITRDVVTLKTLIEQIREQVQNIL